MLVLCNAGCPWGAAIKSASESNKMPQKIIEMPSCSNQMLIESVAVVTALQCDSSQATFRRPKITFYIYIYKYRV